MFHGMDGHGWGMGWAWIIGVIILAFVIWPIYKTRTQNTQSQDINKTPLEILKEKYAKGEIDTQEFEEHKKTLM